MSKVTFRDEQLSAFLDDELDELECPFLVRKLGSDADMRAAAFRMTLMGDAMRGEIGAADPVRFRAAISTAVDEVLLDQSTIATGKSRWLRPLLGAAVAASVAIVAVLSLQQTAVEDLQAPAVTVPMAEAGSVGGSYTVPDAYSRQAGSPNRLSRYYLVHSEYASMMGGQAPLARMVVAPGVADDMDEEGAVEAEEEDAVETQ
jgi:sigma-E factor negative regulatory protein RseA